MDLIAQAYTYEKDDDEDVVNKKDDAKETKLNETRERAGSSSSEYYSTSSESSSSSSYEYETDSDEEEKGRESNGREGRGNGSNAETSDSSESEETAAAAGMIDAIIKSKGWEALNHEDGSDGEDGVLGSGAPPRTKNEVVPEIPKEPLPQDLLVEHDVLINAGTVSSVLLCSNTVVVASGLSPTAAQTLSVGEDKTVGGGAIALEIGNSNNQSAAEAAAETTGSAVVLFDIGSLFCVLSEDKKALPLGYVDEVFGPVKAPLYSLRCSTETIENFVAVEKNVFACKRLSHALVDPQKLYTKGYDNSGKFDEEVRPEEGDFSDDEQELEARRSRRQKKRSHNGRHVPKPSHPHPQQQQHQQQRQGQQQQHHMVGPAPSPFPMN